MKTSDISLIIRKINDTVPSVNQNLIKLTILCQLQIIMTQ